MSSPDTPKYPCYHAVATVEKAVVPASRDAAPWCARRVEFNEPQLSGNALCIQRAQGEPKRHVIPVPLRTNVIVPRLFGADRNGTSGMLMG